MSPTLIVTFGYEEIHRKRKILFDQICNEISMDCKKHHGLKKILDSQKFGRERIFFWYFDTSISRLIRWSRFFWTPLLKTFFFCRGPLGPPFESRRGPELWLISKNSCHLLLLWHLGKKKSRERGKFDLIKSAMRSPWNVKKVMDFKKFWTLKNFKENEFFFGILTPVYLDWSDDPDSFEPPFQKPFFLGGSP